MGTGLLQHSERRQDVPNIFGIWVSFRKCVEECGVFRTQHFLQFNCSLHQCVSLLLILLQSSPDHLLTEIGNLAVSLDLRLIATDNADNLLRVRLQLGDVLLLALRIERRCRNKQNHCDQQPVHKFPGFLLLRERRVYAIRDSSRCVVS